MTLRQRLRKVSSWRISHRHAEQASNGTRFQRAIRHHNLRHFISSVPLRKAASSAEQSPGPVPR
jgi:hypothetical protein